VQAHRAYRIRCFVVLAQKGGRTVDLPILYLGARVGWVVSAKPRPLYLQERVRYSL